MASIIKSLLLVAVLGLLVFAGHANAGVNTNVITSNATPSPDFDGDNWVGFTDFLIFAQAFGSRQGDGSGRYEAKYDLDGDGEIGFGDFLIFAGSFGKEPPSSGGGDGGSPDLVVQSPSVSDNNVASGATFTLGATVRNQGNGSSAVTMLRYYRSDDATVTTSDTQLGTAAVTGLASLATTAHSIDLTAPASTGTYYYGACVDAVTGESDTGNNCSAAVSITVAAVIPSDDRAALVALYEATDGPNWTDKGNWLSAASLGDWYGVITDDNGRVTHLHHGSNTLTGAIPPELGQLTNLTSLSLQNTQLTGAIPVELGQLTKLTSLRLGGNQLTGAIPVELGQLTKLTSLELGGNQLTGAIPVELARLTKLTELDLGGNQLTGAIPVELGQLTKLTELWLSENQLTGAIPPELGQLTHLERLLLYNNQLTGTLPQSLTGLTKLEKFDFALTGLCAPLNAAFQTWLQGIDSTFGENCSGTPPPSGSPDLIVESPSVNDNTLTTGQSFTLRATVRNQGNGSSAVTTLRYYRSDDATIDATDTQLGTDSVTGLASLATTVHSIDLTAPASTGTYYYGVCVAAVTGESDTGNNCSAAVSITVAAVTPPGAGGVNRMYWTDDGTDKIQRSNLDGSGVEDLVTSDDGLEDLGGIALDVSGGKMYWTEAGAAKIQRSNLDGSDVEDLVTTGLEGPVGIALDVSGGKMYWTDVLEGKIQRSNLDGSGVEALVTTGLESPAGIALDVSGGKMYWTEAGAAKIQRSNLDGSDVENLVTTGLEAAPFGIALDVSGGKMYWTEAGAAKIQRSNLDGSGVEDLVTTGLEGPFGIALDVSGGKMYWTDVLEGKIQRSNLDGSGVEALVTTGLEGPAGIALSFGLPVEAGTDLGSGHRSAITP